MKTSQFFAQDKIDFEEATPDRTNKLHGTIIVMFQQETGEARMSKEIGIDRKSKETVSFSDYDVPLSQLSTATLMKPPLEKFYAYIYFTKCRQSQVYETPREKLPLKT